MRIFNFINIKDFIIYLLIINIIAFFTMWLDKKRAKKNKWRISEPTLLGLALFGGSIGSILGMHLFRHKTKKKRFTIGLPVILILQIFIIVLMSI